MKLNLAAIRNVDKKWLVLWVALGLGALSAILIHGYMKSQLESFEDKGKSGTINVVVAKADLVKGSPMTSDTVAVRPIPEKFDQSGAVRPEEFNRIENRTLAHAVKSGELIMWSHLDSPRPATFSTRLSEGQRALTVIVDEINSISGMLEPGDRIDLLFTLDQNGRKRIFPLLQSVPVLATGQRAVDDAKSGERTQYATVTLNTTSDQAKNIILARDTGKITALLRHPEDTHSTGEAPIDVAALLGGVAPARFGGPSRRVIPVIYGGGTSDIPADALRLNGRRTPAAAPNLLPGQPPS